MTAALTTPVNDDPPVPCGPDCLYIDGACRCYHGESVPADFDNPALNNLTPPF